MSAPRGPAATLAPPDVIAGFFATVTFRLEPDGRGTRFPTVMNDLWDGRVDAASAPRCAEELAVIDAELARVPAAQAVWNVDDPGWRPIEALGVDPEAADVRACFRAADGRPLITALRALVAAGAQGGDALVLPMPERRRALLRHWSAVAVGVVWAVVGWVWFPDLLITHAGSTIGMRFWVIGAGMAVAGMAGVVVAMRPGIAAWSRRHPLIAAALIIAAVSGLVWLGLADGAKR